MSELVETIFTPSISIDTGARGGPPRHSDAGQMPISWIAATAAATCCVATASSEGRTRDQPKVSTVSGRSMHLWK